MDKEIQKAIDLSSFQELFEDDLEFQVEILTLFLKETPEKILRIEESLRDGDRDVISKIAHSLKSTLSMLGCSSLLSIATQLEANQGLQKAKMVDLLEQAKRELQEASEVINRVLSIQAA